MSIKIRINHFKLPRGRGIVSGDVDALKNSIRQNALLKPITVARGSDKYILVAGARRLLVCHELGSLQIDSTVLSNANDL